MHTASPLLEVDGVGVRFGGIRALDAVSFTVEAGQIVGLIGPNGAGKTTLFNCLSRLYDVDRGRILFEGRSIGGVAPHRIAALGIARSFQNLALFGTLSVRENVMLGGHARGRSGFVANALRWPRVRREEAEVAARVDQILDQLGLAHVADHPVAGLPFGTAKRVELGRALAAEPRLLLLDEPAGGLNHEEIDAFATLLRSLRERLGLTILLVEHHMGLVMRLCDRIVAIDFGRKIAEGTPEQVQQHPDVIRAYLGMEAA